MASPQHGDSSQMAGANPPHERDSPLSSAARKAQSRKDMFGDCALVEIIHLHDCLRGALRALQRDVAELSQSVQRGVRGDGGASELERRVAARFKLIWSVFQAHSAAEDEFIWPALQSKQNAKVQRQLSVSSAESAANQHHDSVAAADANENQELPHEGQAQAARGGAEDESQPVVIEEYEEDHADEERMFRLMDGLLTKLRAGLLNQPQAMTKGTAKNDSVHKMAKEIDDLTGALSQHLMTHLEKEETQCMPLVAKHLTKREINELVGKIMGKRSSDTIANIMTMAVQNLNDVDREEMIRYMKQAMVGTFFERWLSMGGWMASSDGNESAKKRDSGEDAGEEMNLKQPVKVANETGTSSESKRKPEIESCTDEKQPVSHVDKRPKIEEGEAQSSKVCGLGDSQLSSPQVCSACNAAGHCLAAGIKPPAAESKPSASAADITSQAELEKLIRAIASNPELTPLQKNTTIQGLRDSIWKSNRKQKMLATAETPFVVPAFHAVMQPQFSVTSSMPTETHDTPPSAATATRSRRCTPASSYYKKNREGKVELVWSSDSPSSKFPPDDKTVPLFSASELAPTYHDGATGAVLGCPHYARACKLRHPSSGRLYTCRLCCEQEREMPMKDKDSPLDRYAVTEVLCMRCGALQPAGDHCVNPMCESRGKPYSKYVCSICKFYDDGPSKNIYHCPFCNTCRTGLGLGIDYRHCMRCNACVSLADDEHHCIPQRLQGSCPICHESMFESTEPLRGLKCGHVMHLSCFGMYMRGHSYTCPLCKKSVEDMKDYFSLLDSAVRMQPMPAAYSSTVSNIYCQDCGNTGQVQYHFVGCKCPHCGSYNTRELGRVQGTLQTSHSS